MTETHYTLKPGEYRLQETESPATEPVSVDELKAHVRVSGTAEDTVLASLITAARQACETQVGKCFISRDISVFLDRWPSVSRQPWWDGTREGADVGTLPPIKLPVTPVSAVSGIYLYAANGTATALPAEGYQVDLLGGRVAFDVAPAAPGRILNGIEMRVTAGYGAAGDVPAVFKQAIKQVAAHLYTYRGDVPEQAITRSGAAALLAPYREVALI